MGRLREDEALQVGQVLTRSPESWHHMAERGAQPSATVSERTQETGEPRASTASSSHDTSPAAPEAGAHQRWMREVEDAKLQRSLNLARERWLDDSANVTIKLRSETPCHLREGPGARWDAVGLVLGGWLAADGAIPGASQRPCACTS